MDPDRTYKRLMRTLIALSVLTVIAIIGTGVLVWSKRDSGSTAEHAPAVVMDEHARVACAKLAEADQIRATIDTISGSLPRATAEIRAKTAEIDANTAAKNSAVSELSAIAAATPGAPLAPETQSGMRAWCDRQ